jgi:plasmid stability protein
MNERKPPTQLVVRNLDPELIRRLKARAATAGRSAEAEHRAQLEAALRGEATEFWAECRRMRATQAREGRVLDEMTAIIRHDRDTDHGRDPDQTWRRGAAKR